MILSGDREQEALLIIVQPGIVCVHSKLDMMKASGEHVPALHTPLNSELCSHPSGQQCAPPKCQCALHLPQRLRVCQARKCAGVLDQCQGFTTCAFKAAGADGPAALLLGDQSHC